jgi:hypothetical protein
MGAEYHPCEVLLYDGSVMSNVYVQEAVAWFEQWGVDPEDDPDKQSILVDNVIEIRESPFRMPVRIANTLYQAEPLGREESLFQLVLKNGSFLNCRTGEMLDLLDWPTGVTPDQVIDVRIDFIVDTSAEVRDAEYWWCLYENQ